jgi:hypothetical protein
VLNKLTATFIGQLECHPLSRGLRAFVLIPARTPRDRAAKKSAARAAKAKAKLKAKAKAKPKPKAKPKRRARS